MDSVEEMREFLIECIKKHVPPLRINKDKSDVFEVSGTKHAMQGKQLVDGYYFGSVVPKPKDVRLYFFPIYTHPSAFDLISKDLRKCLKGKSCFHFKSISPEMKTEIESMIEKGIKVYSEENLV